MADGALNITLTDADGKELAAGEVLLHRVDKNGYAIYVGDVTTLTAHTAGRYSRLTCDDVSGRLDLTGWVDVGEQVTFTPRLELK